MDLISLKQRFGIIGNNEVLNRALEIAVRVAGTDLSVLITGESGVGKEVFPQIIHAYSARKHGTYIAVNCGAIPEGTIDSELFGHEKGAFTGATESRKGYFEVANGGTIFLDEVAELPTGTQVRLLRILQTGEYIRVGSSKPLKTNVRVVAATNVDLLDAVARGRFREDLYYRLNIVPIAVPALHDRPEDIHLLFRKFAVDIAEQYRMPSISLTEDARRMLEAYSWPGNVRQLKNVAEQISAVEESRTITGEILKKYLPGNQRPNVPMVREEKRDMSDERELLFKVIFDLHSDIREVKRMMAELMAGGGYERKGEIAGLLPRNLPAPVQSAVTPGEAVEDEFAHTEEVTEETQETPQEELTKEKAQRDAIIRALKRNNGKRKEAARELFISERTLYRRIRELGIEEY